MTMAQDFTLKLNLYGSDFANWPADDVQWAKSLLACDAEAKMLWLQEREFETLLQNNIPAAPDLEHKIMVAAESISPKSLPFFRKLSSELAVPYPLVMAASVLVLGVMLGFGQGFLELIPQTTTFETAELYTETLSFSEGEALL